MHCGVDVTAAAIGIGVSQHVTVDVHKALGHGVHSAATAASRCVDGTGSRKTGLSRCAAATYLVIRFGSRIVSVDIDCVGA